MVRAQSTLPDRQRSPVGRLGLRVAALLAVQNAEVVECRRDLGMARAQRPLLYRQDPPEERLGLILAALAAV